MEFHISRAIRNRLELPDLLFSYTGNVVFANVAASRTLAKQLTELRAAEGRGSEVVNAGALFAMGLIDELSHALIAQYRTTLDPQVFADALAWFGQQATPEAMDRLIARFADDFPTVAVFCGETTVAAWLAESTESRSNREAALEELLLLWLSNRNPAFAPYRELFDDAGLRQEPAYAVVAEDFAPFFATRPRIGTETLLEVLEAPMLASPDSLSGQLDYIRQNWVEHLGEDLRRTLLAIDVLREEEIAIWMRFHPPAPGHHQKGGDGWWAEGFEGDEFLGFGPGGRGRRYASDYQAELNEYEAFSPDQAWMPNVVLMAKSTYVWLEQLSKKYGRHIHRLDQIPDEELKLLADRGMTGLWLIGLWERSVASRTIKRLRGQEDSVASAYSLKDYQIAEDLGGTGAYEHLRDRAGAYGVRLASDMVPNHMGIDSTWVIEHPDWFISRPESPFPSYSFNGPDLSTDSRVEIKIDDHYFDQTDAAVVFRLRSHGSGETRFVYHGNDGTTFAWNDTAQLDYSKAYVREQVIQAILHVARLFPIIRFDAAMTLAKRHVQRLWFPLPGVGGSIPSRAESAMTQEEFDAMMPAEFWREVVDRVAVEVPGTLLLAEAFWMLEGYFVRTLGMHRVYNSAFMNMLRDEENAKYRSYLKKTMEFDPDILKRYVNFMSNPDERTAIDQFGSGDKFFGTCVLMSTLPGLPMFGHGQIEGYTERYGMEYKRARMEEWPNEGLVARHEREIAPLLKRRWAFAESTNFVLYDFWNEHGAVDENVFAYSNRSGDARSLVLYNNVYGSTRGTIHLSAASMDKGSGQLRQRRLHEALDLPSDDGMIVAYRDSISHLEYLRHSRDLDHNGFFTELRGYQYVVLESFRGLRSTAEEPWDRLCDALHGAGVYDLRDALSKLRLRPLHDALREVLTRDGVERLIDAAQKSLPELSVGRVAADKKDNGQHRPTQVGTSAHTGQDLELLAADMLPVFALAKQFGEPPSVEPKVSAEDLAVADRLAPATPAVSAMDRLVTLAGAAARLPRLARGFSAAWPAVVRQVLPGEQAGAQPTQRWAPVLSYVALQAMAGDTPATGIFDRLQLRVAMAESFAALGLEGDAAWRAAARVRVALLADELRRAGNDEALWNDGDAQWLAGVHTSEGRRWVAQEGAEELLCWIALPRLLDAAQSDAPTEALECVEADLEQTLARMREARFDLDEFLAGYAGQGSRGSLQTRRPDRSGDEDAPAHGAAAETTAAPVGSSR